MGRVGLGSNSLLKPVSFYKWALHRQGRCSPPTPLLPLPPPAGLKSAAKVVRGDSSGVGPALAGSGAFRQGSDPAQTRPYGFSRSPKTACWVCLCPEACVPNAGVTPRPVSHPCPGGNGRRFCCPALLVGKPPCVHQWLLKTLPAWRLLGGGSLPPPAPWCPQTYPPRGSVGSGELCPPLPLLPAHLQPPASVCRSLGPRFHPSFPMGL